MQKTYGLSILFVCFSFCLFAGAQERRAPDHQPVAGSGTLVTDHIKHSVCTVKVSKEFATYGLYYHVEYADKPPYDLFVESASDYEALYDECEAFLLAMEEAQIREAVENGKQEMKRRREDHFFLKAKR